MEDERTGLSWIKSTFAENNKVSACENADQNSFYLFYGRHIRHKPISEKVYFINN